MAKPLTDVLEATPRKPGDIVGDRLRHYRQRRGWSQRQFASQLKERFGIIINNATVARLESGDRRVTVDEACLFAVALDVPLGLLLWPIDESESVSVAPGVSVPPWLAFDWMTGYVHVPGTDVPAWTAAVEPLRRLYELFNASAEILEFISAHGDDPLETLEPKDRELLTDFAAKMEQAEAVGINPKKMLPKEVLAYMRQRKIEAPHTLIRRSIPEGDS